MKKEQEQESRDMAAATVRESKREKARLLKIADDTEIAPSATTVAKAPATFRETLGHKIRRWLGIG